MWWRWPKSTRRWTKCSEFTLPHLFPFADNVPNSVCLPVAVGREPLSPSASCPPALTVSPAPFLSTCSLYFNDISEDGKRALHSLRIDRDGVRALVFLTAGTDVSDYWSHILNVVQGNLPFWDRERVRQHLVLILQDLESSRRQAANPWRKAKFLRVESEVKKMLGKLQHGTL